MPPTKKNKKTVEAALRRIVESEHIDAVVEAIVKQFGGTKKLAETFHKEFNSAPEGSPVKARMLDALLQMLESRSKEDHSEQLDLLEDEDLERLAQELMEDDAGPTPQSR